VTAVIVVALVAAVAAAVVVLPLVRARSPVTRAAGARLEALEERDRALAALKELEFDHRTGKIGDTDYRELVGVLRRRAAQALRAAP
jgi:hypothetical protein